MPSLHFAFPLAPLAVALVLGACTATVAPVPTPSAPASVAPSAAPTAAPTPGAATLPFEKLAYEAPPGEPGEPLPVTDARRLRTQADLTKLLDDMKAPTSGRPTVDFTKKEVLAFYDEGGPNGCHELALKELQVKGAVIQPVFLDKPKAGQDDGRVCTMVLVLPRYLLVAIDRSTLPVAGLDVGASPSPSPKP